MRTSRKRVEMSRDTDFEESVRKTKTEVADWPEWKKAPMGLLWVDRNQDTDKPKASTKAETEQDKE